MNDDVRQRMEQLIKELNEASEAYYGGYKELMSDHEWNNKLDELERLETETGIVLDNSPTHKVSDFVSNGNKSKHEYPALSLPKSKDINDVIKWANGKAVDLSWKLDGLTLVVTYDDGYLTKVVTRGDGSEGDDITHLMSVITNIKPTISYKGHLVIRGEAIIAYDDFNTYNEAHNFEYENPRNLAAGSCNPKRTADVIADRGLKWIPFTLVHVDDDINSWKERMQFLQSLGFETVEFAYISDPADISDMISQWSGRVEQFVYPVDGLVIVYDDTDYASQGEFTGHHDTRGGYAFKWQDEEAETYLEHVEWSVSVNSINPVAIFQPVRLEGTTVQRASLCNISECERLGIGSPGTKLTVIKANKIIPKVIKAETVGEFHIPDECPVCHSKTNVSVSIFGTKVLKCSNPDCAAKNVKKLSRFVSKQGFNIQGLSEKKMLVLVSCGLITEASDILSLPSRENDVTAVLSSMDGWGQKSIKNLLSAIQNSLNIKSTNLLYSLCIPMCGRDVAKTLLSEYDLSEVFLCARNGDRESLMAEGIGVVKAQAIIDWFSVEENSILADNVYKYCNIIDSRYDKKADILKGMTFVITGSLETYSSRDVLKEEIQSLGGKVSGSVSAKTTYLINNDITSVSSKNKKAKDLGVRIISEADYLKLKNGESI